MVDLFRVCGLAVLVCRTSTIWRKELLRGVLVAERSSEYYLHGFRDSPVIQAVIDGIVLKPCNDEYEKQREHTADNVKNRLFCVYASI